jgi:hypothetical protein
MTIIKWKKQNIQKNYKPIKTMKVKTMKPQKNLQQSVEV